MDFLWDIWRQFKHLIIFLLLEIISILLILSFNVYQNSYIFETISSIRSNFLSSINLANEYVNLYSKNKELVEENSLLVELLKNNQLSDKDIESEQNEKYKKYIPAQVVYSTIGIAENYLVVNKGRKQGIHPEMAVVSSFGLVGIVYAVTDDYASILPLINNNFSCLVSVSDYKTNASTSWDGNDYRYIEVRGIPLHLSINKGDTIFTNPNSALYPSHELIGTVENIEKEDLGKSFALQVKLATDFSTLQHVYIIDNKDKTQIDSLLNNE